MFPNNGYPALTPACAAAARDVRYHSISLLTFLAWNAIVTFDDEVEYIWTMRNKSPSKLTYFFLRYVILFAHITHNIFMDALANGSNPPMLCDFWWAYTVISSQVVGTLLELVLASRVFAFYNRSQRIGALLSFLILAEAVGSIRLLIPWGNPSYHGVCLLILGAKSKLKEHSIVVFACHCTLASLTTFKYFFALRAGWGRTPLVSLMIRDVSTTYAFMFTLPILMVVICRLNAERGTAIFFWFSAMMSTSGCRMVLSMERLARRQTGTPVETPQPILTSQLIISTPYSI